MTHVLENYSISSSSSSVNASLDVTQQVYQYNYTYIPSIALLDKLPDADQFTNRWFRLLAKQLKVLFVNTLVTNRGNRGSASIRDDVRLFILEALVKGAIPFQVMVIARLLQIIPQLLLTKFSEDFNELDDLLFSILKKSGLSVFKDTLVHLTDLLYQDQPIGHVTQLNDYQKLFPVMKVPAIGNTFQQDDWFAYMQVAGCNPVMIQRVSQLSDRFPVQDQHYQAVMGSDDSLAAAGQEGRLYLADYQIFERALDGSYPRDRKYAYAPLALFAVPRGSDPTRLLRSVAIQCGQTPGLEYPIITPNSGKYAWLFAKAIVQIADANFHEPVTHLARTHLFVGAFVMATLRQLPSHHPLSLLLRPHFEGTLAINDAAQQSLIAPSGGVDRLLSFTIDQARVFAVRGLQSYGFNDAMLPEQLKQRGVDDPNALPIYPYRDDALLIWDAIHQWVSDYLSLYYSSDLDVRKDAALQAWAAEVQAYDGGRISDFGEEGAIQTRNYLVNAIALIIFTASAQHGAVNSPQKDLMSYVPALSLAGYLPASTLQGEVTEQDYLNLLAPLDQAQRQFNLLHLLGSIVDHRLGEYSQEYFTDPQIKPLLQAFQDHLKQIESTIEQRNLTRSTYEYLLPSRIPQSINI